MKKAHCILIVLFFFMISFSGSLFGQYSAGQGSSKEGTAGGENENDSRFRPETKIKYQWFLAYETGKTGGESYSLFHVNRGYINIQTKMTETISTRITPDLTTDRESDGMGDLEMRFKYCYIQFNLPSSSLFTKPTVEFGLVHRPWIDFEEHIVYYRAQGTMFLERNHLLNSGDDGVTFFSLLGGEMSDDYKKNVNSKYPGKYGSFSIGVYNGGGYHALEFNQNKVLESRLTIRPFPDVIPGLQLTYFGAFGKGNTADEPDWTLNSGYLSLEHHRYTFTGTYYAGTGNSGGSSLDIYGNSRDQNGYSVFGELKFPVHKISLFSRYDYFDEGYDYVTVEEKRTIAGIAYHFQGHNKALIDFDSVLHTFTDERDNVVKFTIEVNY